MNVNIFWTGPASRELEVVRELLRPAGRLDVVYGSDGGVEPRSELAEPLRTHLADGGFATTIETIMRCGVTSLHIRAAKP